MYTMLGGRDGRPAVCWASSSSTSGGGDDDERGDGERRQDTTTANDRKRSRPVSDSSNDSSSPSSSPLNSSALSAILLQLRSPPNLLTLSRILATPYLSYLLISDQRPLACAGFLLAGFTDWLDGYLARNYEGMATVLGTYLDPFADKVLVNSMAVTLWWTGTLPGALVGLWLVRDVVMVGAVYSMVRLRSIKEAEKAGRSDKGDTIQRNNKKIAVMDPRQTPLKVEASTLSKVNTTLQIGLIALGISGDLIFVGGLHEGVMPVLCWMTAGTTILSSVGYLDFSAMKKSGN